MKISAVISLQPEEELYCAICDKQIHDGDTVEMFEGNCIHAECLQAARLGIAEYFLSENECDAVLVNAPLEAKDLVRIRWADLDLVVTTRGIDVWDNNGGRSITFNQIRGI